MIGFWATTSNKPLRCVQHIKSLLRIIGRQPTWSEANPEGGWRAFALEALPEPDAIAAEIADDLRSALEQMEAILGDLHTIGPVPPPPPP
ncbi:MAG: hypothetical protein ACK55X_07985 [Synechococcaceae cyanobacterium]